MAAAGARTANSAPVRHRRDAGAVPVEAAGFEGATPR